MAWYDKDSWLTAAFSPSLGAIAITFLVALILPILLHTFLYRAAATTASSLPTFLLVGPSGGGKTAFATLVYCSFSFFQFRTGHACSDDRTAW